MSLFYLEYPNRNTKWSKTKAIPDYFRYSIENCSSRVPWFLQRHFWSLITKQIFLAIHNRVRCFFLPLSDAMANSPPRQLYLTAFKFSVKHVDQTMQYVEFLWSYVVCLAETESHFLDRTIPCLVVIVIALSLWLSSVVRWKVMTMIGQNKVLLYFF